MGIIEEGLGATTLSDGKAVAVEHNESDRIHLHVDDFRLSFSLEEFDRFANAVKEGKEDLLQTKDGV
ncbi:hypothetical protein [Halorussus salinisoli]|uniref:hypothetical protein n=1 Tax=Halorussus salinisoli TaxID=2558242 RepID=UPI0010C22FBB|nr:hypothetical protein [Halorussus salinisoli]